MNIKLTKQETEIVIKAISAYIHEKTRDMVIAESKGLKTISYQDRLTKLQELKTIICNQLCQEETD